MNGFFFYKRGKHTLSKFRHEQSLEGYIVRTRSNRYGVPEKMNLVKGKVQGHAKGFAFILPELEGEKDVYVSPRTSFEILTRSAFFCGKSLWKFCMCFIYKLPLRSDRHYGKLKGVYTVLEVE